jgi:hypothetical protein
MEQKMEEGSGKTRDRLPTVPCDLSEYARRETGPQSWSAATEEDLRELALAIDAFAELFD